MSATVHIATSLAALGLVLLPVIYAVGRILIATEDRS